MLNGSKTGTKDKVKHCIAEYLHDRATKGSTLAACKQYVLETLDDALAGMDFEVVDAAITHWWSEISRRQRNRKWQSHDYQNQKQISLFGGYELPSYIAVPSEVPGGFIKKETLYATVREFGNARNAKLDISRATQKEANIMTKQWGLMLTACDGDESWLVGRALGLAGFGEAKEHCQ